METIDELLPAPQYKKIKPHNPSLNQEDYEDCDNITNILMYLITVRNKLNIYQWHKGLFVHSKMMRTLDEKIDEFMELFTKKFGFPEILEMMGICNLDKSELILAVVNGMQGFEELLLEETTEEDAELLKKKDEVIEVTRALLDLFTT
jgi:hypothetical protein